MKKKVVLGLSGGVDSAVSAYLLQKEGFDVIGVHMIMSDVVNTALRDAQTVADALSIPCHAVDLKDSFKHNIIDYFVNAYVMGSTPNPCVVCNRFVKWKVLLDKAAEFGCDNIATGHYAKVVKKGDRYTVKTSKTDKKDQTYALYNVTQEQLSKAIMPIGHYIKEEVRQIAAEAQLPVAKKPDSQEICFIPDDDYAGFIKQHVDATAIQKGNFIDEHHNVLGQHQGIVHYTVGQRKGLGIAFGTPRYVTEIIQSTNEVVLGTNDELFKHTLCMEHTNFMSIEKLDGEMRVFGKIRYAHKKSPCTIRMKGDFLEAVFDEPQRAITKGQAAVFYDDEDCIVCGGIIL